MNTSKICLYEDAIYLGGIGTPLGGPGTGGVTSGRFCGIVGIGAGGSFGGVGTGVGGSCDGGIGSGVERAGNDGGPLGGAGNIGVGGV